MTRKEEKLYISKLGNHFFVEKLSETEIRICKKDYRHFDIVVRIQGSRNKDSFFAIIEFSDSWANRREIVLDIKANKSITEKIMEKACTMIEERIAYIEEHEKILEEIAVFINNLSDT